MDDDLPMVPENTRWTVRPYGEGLGDYQRLCAWREAHEVPALQETIIPPLSVFAVLDGEPVAFASCYQSYGIGVCFLDWLTTRPGLDAAHAREALRHVINGIAECTKATHALMMGHCTQLIAREAGKLGFVIGNENHLRVLKRID